MRKERNEVCPNCLKANCKTPDDCYMDWQAKRQQDFNDWVASMEAAVVDRMINEKRGK